MFDLAGKQVLITGGAGLLGGQFARALAKAGANLVVSDLNGDSCRALVAEITSTTDREVLSIEADITQPPSVAAMVNEAVERCGNIDILVNCAQAQSMDGATKPFEEFSLEVWNKIMGVDVTGTFLCCQAVGRHMAEHRGGTIINISSIYGSVGPNFHIYDGTEVSPPPAIYSVTKAGIVGLTRYLATYWADKGIRVNALTPGGVLSQQDPRFVEQYSERTPMGRMANKEDLTGALLYLVSDSASYVTGHNLVVDGGWTAW